MRLRPAQQAILDYAGGRMAVSAVPGSGKTFVLTRLAAKLIAGQKLGLQDGQSVLVVTYLNASVDSFKARIAALLHEQGLPQLGYDVRTLHSLAREILLFAPAAAGVGTGDSPQDADPFPILDEGQTSLYLSRAVDSWVADYTEHWNAFLPPAAADSPRMRTRWRTITRHTANSYIRAAKNARYTPAAVHARLAAQGADEAESRAATPLLAMLNGIYARYQRALETQGALDFDDLVWKAVDLLERNPAVTAEMSRRWPFVLEDEAQDSIPLQEVLLRLLTGQGGNWVRVGDPNQAITSSFTSAHPRHFRAFLALPDVAQRPLPSSGRSSPKIMELANRLVEWACTEHPVPEVRQVAFRLQRIQPAPPGDVQPNPPDSMSEIQIRVYRHREGIEVPTVARQAHERTVEHPEQTVAVLVPTNETGYRFAEQLDLLGAEYDELLRGGRTREVASTLYAILALLADPLDPRQHESALDILLGLERNPLRLEAINLSRPDRERLLTLMRSVRHPEALIFPRDGLESQDALPRNVATPGDLAIIDAYVGWVREALPTLQLPPDGLVLTLSDWLFEQEGELAVAYQISTYFQALMDANPTWRLPELVAQLDGLVSGRVQLAGFRPTDLGYQPQPGRITLTTQHRAKGLEWDTVYLVGIDSFWIPSQLEGRFMGVEDFLGGDPSAEAAAQLRRLMEGDADLLPGLDATETSHVEVIAERLRLLYVGITRARLNLFISRSRRVTVFDNEHEAAPATPLGVLHRHLQRSQKDTG